MNIKKFFSFFMILLFFLTVPFTLLADDFGDDDLDNGSNSSSDDLGSDDSSDSGDDFGDSTTKDDKSDSLDSLDDSSKKDSVKDDLGLGDDTSKKKDSTVKEDLGLDDSSLNAPKKVVASSGVKPVAIIKGGYYLFAQYKGMLDSKTHGERFGALDEGIFGAQYQGKTVFAKATMNLRTENALLDPKITLGLGRNNYEQVAPYEIYGGMKLFDVITLRAGNMIPVYGLVEDYQHTDIVIGTPFGNRALSIVQALVPETDAGVDFGIDYALDEKSGIKANLMLGAGKMGEITSAWDTDRTMAIYGRGGYYSDMITAYLAFQYRTNYSNSRACPLTSIGVHSKIHYEGFETLFSFDYNMQTLLKTGVLKKTVNIMLLHIMPAYNIPVQTGGIDKFQLALRFDYVGGVFNAKSSKSTLVPLDEKDSLNYDMFSKSHSLMRVGFAANIYSKEIEGVKSFFGLSFLTQLKTDSYVGTTSPANKKKDNGFMSLMFQGGAEF